MVHTQSFQQLTESPVLVYGAGAISRVILPYLLHNEKIRLLGVAVSENAHSTDLGDLPISVKSIGEWDRHEEKTVILIATSQQYHAEIASICERHGYNQVIPLSSELKDELILEYYCDFFAKKSVSMENESFELERMTFINPLKKSVRNGINLFSQIGDLVLPNVYNNWNVVVEGPYDFGKVNLFPGDIVLDCGANMGTFSVYAASIGCTCHAFEPTPELQPILAEHSRMNNGRIIHIPSAVADMEGTAEFYIDPYSTGGNSILDRVKTSATITVSKTTIDAYVRRNDLAKVDFIKADIEGAERLMLMGAQWTLRTFAPKLSLCTYHLPDDKDVLTELILRANPNYKIEYHWQKLYAWV